MPDKSSNRNFSNYLNIHLLLSYQIYSSLNVYRNRLSIYPQIFFYINPTLSKILTSTSCVYYFLFHNQLDILDYIFTSANHDQKVQILAIDFLILFRLFHSIFSTLHLPSQRINKAREEFQSNLMLLFLSLMLFIMFLLSSPSINEFSFICL